MQRFGPSAAVLAWLLASQATVHGDWKSNAAKKAIGRAAQEAIQDAIRDEVQDAAFEAAVGAVGSAVFERERLDSDDLQFDSDRRDFESYAEITSTASNGIEVAMTAAEVASSIDTALDVADAAKKVNRGLKAAKKLSKLHR
jgi:squalene cyclase